MLPATPGQRCAPARRRSVAIFLVFSLLLLAIPTQFIPIFPTAAAATGDLFFSEYIEGSSNNKALELYNPSGAAVNLSTAAYTVEMYFNGSASAGFTANLTGTVAANGTFVLAPTNANATILGVANQQAGASWFNGDDAVVLKKNGVIVDSIGQVGSDPGTEWGSGLQSTADNTLRRKSTICTGDPVANNAFDPSVEWDGFSQDTFGGLGSHTATCGTTTNPGALQFSAAAYNVAENNGSITVNVTRTGGDDGAVSVNYATVAGGSATAGGDYTSASGTLNFADGETSKNFSVTILDDADFEGDETVSLALSVPGGGATLGSPSTAVLTINDNETPPNPAVPGSVVISQVYGGGGNTGAFYRYDFIELFNRSSEPVNLNGWSVQYASATGVNADIWNRRTPLTGTIQPGQYFLIREASGSNVNAADLPTPDVTGTIAMGGTDGKVALVSNNLDLPNGCPVGNPNIIDFVGYGAATCFEGSEAAPQLSNTTAALRTRSGCKDSDLNHLNFTEVAPAPRNSASSFNVCPAGDFAPEVFSTNPANGASNIALASNVVVNFDAAVNVTDGAFTLSCTKSGPHALTVTGGPTTFTLNPDTDLQSGEQCTATVLASHVSSQGTTPVQMAADRVWSFGTLIVRDPAEHMVMGNPSGAVTDPSVPLNYLMMKPQYALSYNNDRGISNWTSWHLDSTWLGSTPRQDFEPDTTLPAGFKQVSTGYNFGTYGFERGHIIPSADRTSSVPDNSATFLMTNMMPQAPGNNGGPWAELENHIRTLLNGTTNELYIVAGGHGVGGSSPRGEFNSITDTAGNSVTVPDVTWKVVMVMPRADGDDVARVTDATRTFAVIMPNDEAIEDDDWKKYLATVDQVEALTGFNFFSNVPEEIQNVIEARLDEEYDTAPVASGGQPVVTAEDTQKEITLSATDFNVHNALTYTVVDAPTHGTVSAIADGKLTYTPDENYNGPDSFTFKASDGAKESNVATVGINVTPVNDAPTLSGVPEAAAINELSNYTFTATASDVDAGQTLTFSLINAPAGAAIDATSGVFNWTPTEAQGGTGTPYVITVRVSDGTSDADSTVSITVNEVNSAPSLAAIGNQTIAFGSTLTFTASGSDADLPAQTLTYSLTGNVPAGATIDPSTGAFSWTPTAAQAGQGHSFNVRVTDDGAGNLYAEQTVSVNVAYTMTGVLQPIKADGSSVFKAGQTVPVKFQLTGASAGITDAVVRLYVAKISNSVVGEENAAGSTSNATAGNLFRYSDGQYIFNLSTAGLTPGVYQLRIDAGDGVQHVFQISLR